MTTNDFNERWNMIQLVELAMIRFSIIFVIEYIWMMIDPSRKISLSNSSGLVG